MRIGILHFNKFFFKPLFKKYTFYLLGLLVFSSCIDRINIAIPDHYASQIVVDGLITDEPGPYTVRLTKSTRIENFLLFSREALTSAKVIVSDNVGNSELLKEKEPGVYETSINGMRGIVGREYIINIETKDGKIFESIPEKISPVGEIDNLYYEFESFQPLDAPTEYGFRFFIDTESVPNIDNLVRWKFTGIFKVEAEPKLHTSPGCIPDPRFCSGFVRVDGGIRKVAECSCCECWVTRNESKPNVSDNQFVNTGKIRRIEVGYIPIEYYSFLRKYRVEVKQMSLSRGAYDYWRIIRSQKEGAASLFQPPTGKTRTNIFDKNGIEEVQGFFYASSVKTRQIYLSNADVPVNLRIPRWDCEDKGIIPESCLYGFKFSSTQPPADWK
jgi:Domain of unknown function (DUF4249)